MGQRTLKITIQNGGKDVTLRLEGKVAGPWAQELERTWHGLETSLGSKKLSVDLREVRYIDQAGRNVLIEMGKSRVEFLADSPLTRYFAEEATRPDGKSKRARSENGGQGGA